MFYYKAFHFIREGKIGFKHIDIFIHKYDLAIFEFQNCCMKLITNLDPISNLTHNSNSTHKLEIEFFMVDTFDFLISLTIFAVFIITQLILKKILDNNLQNNLTLYNFSTIFL